VTTKPESWLNGSCGNQHSNELSGLAFSSHAHTFTRKNWSTDFYIGRHLNDETHQSSDVLYRDQSAFHHCPIVTACRLPHLSFNHYIFQPLPVGELAFPVAASWQWITGMETIKRQTRVAYGWLVVSQSVVAGLAYGL